LPRSRPRLSLRPPPSPPSLRPSPLRPRRAVRHYSKDAASPIPPLGESEASAVETALQRVMRLQSEARFRVYGGCFLLVGMGSWIYGNKIMNYFSGNVAEVTSKSIASEEVQLEVQSLAIGAVNTVLKDEVVLQQTVEFLKRLVAVPETQVALAQLLVAALQNPATLEEASRLSQHVVAQLLNDRATMEQVTKLFGDVLQQPWTKRVVLDLLQQLMEDEGTRRALGALLVQTLAQENVVQSATDVAMSATHTVFNDEQVASHATLWVQHVLGDQSVQQKSGEHLWNAFTYAINPFGGGGKKTPKPGVVQQESGGSTATTGAAEGGAGGG
jgi:hypothetical protein